MADPPPTTTPSPTQTPPPQPPSQPQPNPYPPQPPFYPPQSLYHPHPPSYTPFPYSYTPPSYFPPTTYPYTLPPTWHAPPTPTQPPPYFPWPPPQPTLHSIPPPPPISTTPDPTPPRPRQHPRPTQRPSPRPTKPSPRPIRRDRHPPSPHDPSPQPIFDEDRPQTPSRRPSRRPARPPQSPPLPAPSPPEPDPKAATRELEAAAQKAASHPDPVSLALLLSTWQNSLADTPPSPSSAHFARVFHASATLHIVTSAVLLLPLPKTAPVREALVSLCTLVLYGPAQLHARFADAVAALNYPLDHSASLDLRQVCAAERHHALRAVQTFLRDLELAVAAYQDVLPLEEPASATPASPTYAGPAPAGPDPAKAVERCMHAWRRALARLQAQMAIVVVLEDALEHLDQRLVFKPDNPFLELEAFYACMKGLINAEIVRDIDDRKAALDHTFWKLVCVGPHLSVFDAAKCRAQIWLGQFETAKGDVEAQLDDAGIGFGPSARVSHDKFAVLVSASAGVAALVSCHQHAFSWAKEVANLLASMVTAFHALEGMSRGRMGPPKALKGKFFAGVEDAFVAIDNVVNWSFTTLHDKVLGSLEKSMAVGALPDATQQTKVRALRFEEPVKTPATEADVIDGEAAPVQSRRKPRHARMKSSPDALLHLNANFDTYSDSDNDVDREIETSDDREREASTLTESSLGGQDSSNSSDHTEDIANGTGDASWKRGDDELPVVYENQTLEYKDDEDRDDHEIIVHDNMEDSAKPKKVNHSSHVRSMSVDGIPF